MRYLKQSTSVDVGIGPFLDETDGKTAETALTITQPDIRLKKNGGAWAQKAAAQTLTHEEAGWYELTLDATDTDTIGHLLVAVHESGALPVWLEFHVLAANVYDSLFGAATDKLDVNVEEWNTTAVPAEHTAGYPIVTVKNGTGTGEINTNAGAIALVDLVTTTTTATNVTTVNGLAANVITAAAIATGAIDADAIADNAIDAGAIAADAITAAKIADGAIDAATFAAGAITAAAIATDAIDADAIKSDAVTEIQSGLATASQISALAVNTRANLNVPVEIETPDASTLVYKIRLHLFDVEGNMEAPDSTPTVALTNAAGTDRSSRLSAASNPSTGVYTWDYTATAGDAEEQLVWVFTVVEGGATRTYPATSYVVEESAYRFSSSDRSTLNAIVANVWTNGTRTLTSAANITSTGGTTVPQTGDSFARLGAPAGASVSADVAAVKTDTAGIKTKTDSLTFTTALKVDAKLTSDGLDNIAVTASAGVASTFREMIVQVWRRFFKKSTLTSTQLKTYADNGTDVLTTQTVSDDLTTQTQGPAT